MIEKYASVEIIEILWLSSTNNYRQHLEFRNDNSFQTQQIIVNVNCVDDKNCHQSACSQACIRVTFLLN